MVRDNKASTQKENNNIRIDFNSYVCCVAHIANITSPCTTICPSGDEILKQAAATDY